MYVWRTRWILRITFSLAVKGLAAWNEFSLFFEVGGYFPKYVLNYQKQK